MVVAPLGKGKSLYLANQAVRSLVDGNNVLYITLEMSEDKTARRLDSIMTRIPQSKLEDKLLEVKERLAKFKLKYPNGNLVIKEFPMNSVSTNAIKALIHQLNNHKKFIPNVIIIDYLELLNPIRDGGAEYISQELVARDLKGLAMEYECLVVTASQVNRQGANIPIITDKELADSYGKARPMELVFSLNQTEEEYDNGKMRVYIFKNRNGRSRKLIPTKINYSTLVMDEEEVETVNA